MSVCTSLLLSGRTEGLEGCRYGGSDGGNIEGVAEGGREEGKREVAKGRRKTWRGSRREEGRETKWQSEGSGGTRGKEGVIQR